MSSFKVMTWNIENLFQVGGESGPKTEDEYQKKLESLAEAIKLLAPDVLALQEIGSLVAFDDLMGLLQGNYPHSQLSENPDPRGIRVGFVSRLPIEEFEDILEFPETGLASVPGIDSKGNPTEVTRLGRGALRIRVDANENFAVHLITAHLKSKLLTFPSPTGNARFNPKNEDERAKVAGIALLKRTAEATALRIKSNELVEANASQGLIVLGDLNDVTDAATTQILNGPGGSEIGSGGFNRPDKGDDSRLFNLAPLISEDRRYSRIYQGSRELIDHILVSEEFMPGKPRALPTVDSHVDIFGQLPSVTDDPGTRRGKPASDHAPVTAIFEL